MTQYDTILKTISTEVFLAEELLVLLEISTQIVSLLEVLSYIVFLQAFFELLSILTLVF